MTEPTIDEMLEWLNQYDDEYDDDIRANAIRAILDQHREPPQEGRDMVAALLAQEVLRNIQLEAIRAFVERVELRGKQYGKSHPSSHYWHAAVLDELTAMEGER